MKLCRFLHSRPDGTPDVQPRLGLVLSDEECIDLSALGWPSLTEALEYEDLKERLQAVALSAAPRLQVAHLRLLAPVERQEVWAAGVTYQRSKAARMEESEFSATAYDRVYDAARPELFFKSLGEKVRGPGEPVGVRRDSRWTVPEPELALVLNSRGEVVGCTIGNDMSARDIEGENLLYLPQAKIYRGSCALGPWIVVGSAEEEVRSWTIELRILQAHQELFSGRTEVGRLKRTFSDLAEHLFRCQSFPHGAVLLTGTGIVPPDGFTLRGGETVRITISGIGTLENPVELL